MVWWQNPTCSHSRVSPCVTALPSLKMCSTRCRNVWVLGRKIWKGIHWYMGIFSPSAQSDWRAPLSSVYRKHEQEKRRQYDQRVREIEHATFTPLVLSTMGGMGRAATTFYKRLAAMMAEKRDVPYAVTLNWIRCRLSFALLRASIMSIRGVRSSRHHPVTECPIDLQLAEGRLN